MSNIYVLGKRYSGKTPFSIQVAAVSGLQHIEALNWLRSQFECTDFAHMLFDAELMNQIVTDELRMRPRACADYVRMTLSSKHPAIVDGLFSLEDFLEFFDPTKDHVVELVHTQSKVNPTSYEGGLEDISKHIQDCIDNGSLPRERVFRYRFAEFHRKRGVADSITVNMDSIECCTLSAAIEHYITDARLVAAAS